jgi:hypothetical protein
MAIDFTTTPARADESAVSRGSPVTSSYSHFLLAADRLIAAERDLARHSGQDPAVDAWICDAEIAFGHVSGALKALFAARPTTRDERRLQQIGRLFHFVMLSDDPADVATVRAQAGRLHEAHRRQAAQGQDPAAHHLLLLGWQKIEAFLAVDDIPSPDTALAPIEQEARLETDDIFSASAA